MSAVATGDARELPPSYRLYRAAIVIVFLLILLVVGLGAGGHGPAHALHKPVHQGITWVKKEMDIKPQ